MAPGQSLRAANGSAVVGSAGTARQPPSAAAMGRDALLDAAAFQDHITRSMFGGSSLALSSQLASRRGEGGRGAGGAAPQGHRALGTPAQGHRPVGPPTAAVSSTSTARTVGGRVVSPAAASSSRMAGHTTVPLATSMHRPASVPVGQAAVVARPAASATASGVVGKSTGQAAVAAAETKWACERCGELNPSGSDACTGCAAPAPAPLAATRRAPLTLAQQRGLVPAPPPLLTAAEWVDVEARAAARYAGVGAAPTTAVRGAPPLPAGAAIGSREPEGCSICLDGFGLRQAVLLSCSHVFHRACMASLER
jgi:hypothetical protein